MAKYTTAVRTICEVNAGLTEGKGYDSIDEVIKSAIPKIFSFDFPIFDENYRVPLCVKILKHYYMREICEETVGLWKLRLDTKLNEIMPYYNELYKSTLLEFDPLIDTKLDKAYNLKHAGETIKEETITKERETTDNLTVADGVNKTVTDNTTTTDNSERHLTDTETGRIDGNSTDTSKKSEKTEEANNTTQNTNENENKDNTRDFSHNNTSYDLFNETPQGGLNGLESGEYLTNARKLTDETKDITKDEGHRDKEIKFTGNLTGSVDFSTDNTDTKNYGENSNKEKTAEETNTNTKTVSGNVTDNTQRNGTENRTVNGNEKEGLDGKVGVNNTDDYVEHITGKSGGNTYASMLLEFRKTLINIDKMIIEELADLFFMLW